VEEKKERLKLHGCLDLVEAKTDVEEEPTEVEMVIKEENEEAIVEFMDCLFGREDHDLDQIFARHLE
jgi:hypothetical protein